MANDFASLAQAMKRISANLPSFSNGLKKEVAETIDSEVVLHTPVDEGDARSNWVVSLANPTVDFIPAYAPGKHLGIQETANAFAALIQARGEIANALPGVSIYISNNTPYIGILNTGTSRQAPALFIESSINQGILSASKVQFPA